MRCIDRTSHLITVTARRLNVKALISERPTAPVRSARCQRTYIPSRRGDTPPARLPLAARKVIGSRRLSVTPIHRCFLCEPLSSVCLRRGSGMDGSLAPQLFTGDFTTGISHLTRFVSSRNGFLNGRSRNWARLELTWPFKFLFVLLELLKEVEKCQLQLFCLLPRPRIGSPPVRPPSGWLRNLFCY